MSETIPKCPGWYVSPKSLTCICVNACDFCKNTTDKTTDKTTDNSDSSCGCCKSTADETDGSDSSSFYLTVRLLFGWSFCKNCFDAAKQNAIKYCNALDMIPFFWLGRASTKFYRESQKAIEVGQMDFTNNMCVYSPKYDMLRLPMIFGENGRVVSLENIFHHNPGLYQQLKDCENLFDDGRIHIKYTDLSQKIHDFVEIAFERSKQPSESFSK
ncbi:MAG: hypothetical protein Terrestrivirus1_76 [Terrestrivirus sp.]|uniref:Uncharacterized protein n=1 Tax=Terrestrivirus sp. TaxID=2487775 RepID=A0A3G4ZK41_9VIRU|nr:MAG: hypothetical protein Terrestrivirus1_76 [Terrestrivirus sp.]